MSALCLFDLSDNQYDFEQLNRLSKELMKKALKNNIAVFFNSYDYGIDIIKEAKMKNFFLLSDSLLYKNCDFLDMTWVNFNLSIEKIKESFVKKYKFFDEILKTLFDNGLTNTQIYITEDGAVNSLKDFIVRSTTKERFLIDLFESIVEFEEEYSFQFPTIKFNVC